MRWPWQKVGPPTWPPGPATIDWDLDLERGSLGPLRIGSTVDEVAQYLGRPDRPESTLDPGWLAYDRFDLVVMLADGLVEEFEFERELPNAPKFTGRIRLRTQDRRLETLRREDLIADYGPPTDSSGEPGDGLMEWWTLGTRTLCVCYDDDTPAIESVSLAVGD